MSTQSNERATVTFLKTFVLEKVITTLLAEQKPGSKNLGAEEAIARIHMRSAGYISVRRILKEMKGIPRSIVDFAVEVCLKKRKRGWSYWGEALPAAGEYIAYGASVGMKERVILEMAREGFCGRIEAIARAHLKRDLSPREVRLLVKAYCAERATRSKDTEEHLRALAQRCLSKSEAQRVTERLRRFAEKFDSCSD